jgi:hypothetical protein
VQTCARPHRKAEDWAMWTRIGGASILFVGLMSTLAQAILLQGSPLIGVAFGDCVVGAIGIFAASYMTRRPGLFYLALTVVRLAVAIGLFSAFLGTFAPRDHLSHLLCQVVLEEEAGATPDAVELAACNHAGAVVTALVSVAFVLSVTLFWYPCFRCSLYFVETLSEKEALEGLLSDAHDSDDEGDIVLQSLTSASPAPGAQPRDREFKDSSETVVTPPMAAIVSPEQ